MNLREFYIKSVDSSVDLYCHPSNNLDVLTHKQMPLDQAYPITLSQNWHVWAVFRQQINGKQHRQQNSIKMNSIEPIKFNFFLVLDIPLRPQCGHLTLSGSLEVTTVTNSVVLSRRRGCFVAFFGSSISAIYVIALLLIKLWRVFESKLIFVDY